MNKAILNGLKNIFWKLPIGTKAKEKIRQVYATQKDIHETISKTIVLKKDVATEEYIKGILQIPNAKAEQYREYEKHDVKKRDVDIIAYYLTQFHPNPQNDEWWGKGTTEWTNVSKAVPQFVSHYQPRLPGELGYYDLRIKDNMKRQIELAQNYGIDVFCFYYYWFSGERLLERPLNMFLNDKSLEMKFCLCWANENWTRRFSGTSADVLMKVGETKDENINFVLDILETLQDPRYYSIDGRPVLVVYRPAMISQTREVLKEWRKIAREKIDKELYIIAVQEKQDTRDWVALGYDAEAEFQPKRVNNVVADITDKLKPIRQDFLGEVKDYRDLVEKQRYIVPTNISRKVYPAVMPMWDNTARRDNKALVYHGSNPDLYKKWLKKAINMVKSNSKLDKRLVFINAWNEWGEGAYLEPDRYWGYAYLQATYEALEEN